MMKECQPWNLSSFSLQSLSHKLINKTLLGGIENLIYLYGPIYTVLQQ